MHHLSTCQYIFFEILILRRLTHKCLPLTITHPPMPLIKNEKKQPKRRDIHRQILETARVSPDCIEVATSKASAEANPVGRATTRLFESITNRRPYDAYCRPVLEDDNKGEDNSRGVFQQINDIRPAHRPLHEIRAEAKAKIDAIRRKGEDPELLDKILSSAEYEPTTYGPPELRSPIKGILRSRGNERFFQDCK